MAATHPKLALRANAIGDDGVGGGWMNTGCRHVVPARRIDEHDRANLPEPLPQRFRSERGTCPIRSATPQRSNGNCRQPGTAERVDRRAVIEISLADFGCQRRCGEQIGDS
jgi:hypothetical protein